MVIPSTEARRDLLHKRLIRLLPLVETHDHGGRVGEAEFYKRLCGKRGTVAAVAVQIQGLLYFRLGRKADRASRFEIRGHREGW